MLTSFHLSRRAFFVAAALLMLTACGGSSNPPVNLTAADAGKTVTVVLNNQVTLTLDGNPTTGYVWEVAPDSTPLLKQNGQYEYKAANTGVVGSSGQFVFKFEVVGAGTGKLKMIYHRPFEKGTPPIQTFEVNINAAASATSGY